MDRQINEYESISGIERLLLTLKEGRALGGLRNVEATEIIRRSKETDFGASERRLILLREILLKMMMVICIILIL